MSEQSSKSIEELKAELARLQHERAAIHFAVAARSVSESTDNTVHGNKIWLFVAVLAVALLAFGGFAVHAANTPMTRAHAPSDTPEEVAMSASGDALNGASLSSGVTLSSGPPASSGPADSTDPVGQAEESELEVAAVETAIQPRSPRRLPEAQDLNDCAGSTDPLCGI